MKTWFDARLAYGLIRGRSRLEEYNSRLCSYGDGFPLAGESPAIYMMNLAVQPDYRRLGIAKAMSALAIRFQGPVSGR
jgi:ribosomal protein S18 acetylase RimI-like enzyme